MLVSDTGELLTILLKCDAFKNFKDEKIEGNYKIITYELTDILSLFDFYYFEMKGGKNALKYLYKELALYSMLFMRILYLSNFFF